MADESDNKPVTPPAGDNGGTSSPAPPPSPTDSPEQTSTVVSPQATSTQVNPTATSSTPPGPDGGVPGNSVPRPESSLVQSAGQQQSTTTSTQQQQPPLPPRNYPRDPQWLQYGSLPAVQASRVLPRFFKILSIVIFITGSSATLLTFLYQRFVLPKLLLTRARLASLQNHQTSLYDKLVLSAQSLVYSNPSMYPQTQSKLAHHLAADPTLPAAAQADISKAEEVLQETSLSESEEEPLFADESPLEVSKELEVSPDSASVGGVTSELQSSISRLQTALKKHLSALKTAEVTNEDDDEDESGLPDQTPTQKTMKSLEELSTFLTNEAFYASTPAFSAASYGWNYGASSSIPQRSGMDREKIAQLKNEIRSLKGMLLTRRNFAIPKQDIQV